MDAHISELPLAVPNAHAKTTLVASHPLVKTLQDGVTAIIEFLTTKGDPGDAFEQLNSQLSDNFYPVEGGDTAIYILSPFEIRTIVNRQLLPSLGIPIDLTKPVLETIRNLNAAIDDGLHSQGICTKISGCS